MANHVCPHCHQPIREMRVGVRLPVVKAAIFDAIKAAGDVGISSREIIQALGRSTTKAIKSHVLQINDLLEETDYRIATNGRGNQHFVEEGRWHLVRRRRLRIAA